MWDRLGRWSKEPDPETVARDLAQLWDRETGEVPTSSALRAAVVDQFHRMYYHSNSTWQQTYYRGLPTWKSPLDLWVYQEIVHEVRPSLIVETGTAYGGSALYLADLCETIATGRVVTIDIRERAQDVSHARLTKLIGSSSDEGIRDEALGLAQPGEPVMVVLDADHASDHVLAELRLWADHVTPGSYLIVEDTNINGHPVFPGFGPGPAEALAVFLAERDDFAADMEREKFMMTWNPGGYLKRTQAK